MRYVEGCLQICNQWTSTAVMQSVDFDGSDAESGSE